ncbi:hypothetical protein [Calidifontibacter indicus]|uniref:hypothetical protein n=1 Tax=Calidifontibacter indicus TaxID=419650 RepID=UPI003D7436F9
MAVDTSRTPGGLGWATATVEAVVAHGDLAERHYLEVKSEVALEAPEGLAKLAKFILGAANRNPDIASTHFRGFAVLILGVGDGSRVGVSPLEKLALDQRLRKYLGPEPPHWDLVYLPADVDDRQVLVAWVEPPQWGSDPYPCWGQLDNPGGRKGPLLERGAIYVRRDGETTSATPEEVLALSERARRTIAGPASVDVEVTGKCLAWDWSEAEMDRQIDRFLHAHGVTTDEEAHRVTLRSTFPVYLDAIAAVHGPPIEVRVANRGTHLNELLVTIRFEDGVEGLDWLPESEIDRVAADELPDGPWSRRSTFPQMAYPRVSRRGYPLTFANRDGHLILKLTFSRLNQEGDWISDDDDLRIITRKPVGEAVRATWTAAAKDIDVVARGEIELPVVRPHNPAHDDSNA